MAEILDITGPQPGPQEEFCNTPAIMAICGGSFFGGKSVSIVMEAGRNVDHPKYRGVIFRRTYTQITDAGGLADIASILYPKLGGVPTDNRVLWKFPSGATVKFNHLQHDSDMFKYRSSQFCFLGIDQIEEFPMEAVFYLRARNRASPGYNRKVYFRASCNPEPGWLADLLSWWWNSDTGYPIKERSGVIRYFTRKNGEILWVDKNWTDGNIKPISFTFVPSKMEDNKIGMQNNPDYESTVSTMDNVSVERYLKGNWLISYSGGMFQKDWFKIIELDQVPKNIKFVRYWDWAASEKKEGKDPDFTAGALCGYSDGDFYIVEIRRFQEAPGTTEKKVKLAAELDGYNTLIAWEEEKGSAGKFNSHYLSGKLNGYQVHSDPVSGDKVERAKPLASAAFHGHVFVVKGTWNADFFAEAGMFGSGRGHKDQIDACTGAHKVLTRLKRVWEPFAISNIVKIEINWQKPNINTLHYGALFKSIDNNIYFLCALWDSVEGILIVYDAVKWESVISDQIAITIIKQMRMRQVSVTRLVGNDSLFSDSNDTAKQINKSISKQGDVFKKITKPLMYDQSGSIVYVNSMFSSDSILVSDKLKEPASQFASWNYTEDGKKPVANFVYCECLCLIAAELKTDIGKATAKPKQKDYEARKIEEPTGKDSWETA
jgi:predicted phage terminase large subunit-like protein